MAQSGRIHSLESFGTLDGPGVRYVIFFQGCALRCRYCHNPDSWNIHAGEERSPAELMRKIESCRNFIRSGGVTLSGGEPLLQAEFALELLRSCRASGFHTALDTAGSVPLTQSRDVIDEADLLLLDMKSLDPELCLALTGEDNQHMLATLDYCEKTGKEVWIRHVLVPGMTLDERRLKELAAFLTKFRCVEKVELLPYHRMGDFKWAASGMANPLADVREPTREEYENACRFFT